MIPKRIVARWIQQCLALAGSAVPLLLSGAALAEIPSASYDRLPEIHRLPQELSQSHPHEGRRGRVLIHLAAPGEGAPELESSLEESLSSSDLAVDFRRSTDFSIQSVSTQEPGAVAHVWIDVTRVDTAWVLVVDGPSDRILSRQAVSRKDGDDLAWEQVALLVQTSVESTFDLSQSLRAASKAGSAHVDAKRTVRAGSALSADTQSGSAEPRSVVRLSLPLTTTVGVAWLAPQLPALPTVGMQLGVASHKSQLRPALWLFGKRTASTQLEAGSFAVSVTPWTAGMGGSIQVFHTAGMNAALAAGASLYLWSLTDHARPAGGALEKKAVADLVPSVGLQVGFPMRTGAEILCAFGMEIDPAPRGLVVLDEGTGEVTELMTQGTFRPQLTLGFRFDLARIQEPRRAKTQTKGTGS